jgi:hypothetical protein
LCIAFALRLSELARFGPTLDGLTGKREQSSRIAFVKLPGDLSSSSAGSCLQEHSLPFRRKRLQMHDHVEKCIGRWGKKGTSLAVGCGNHPGERELPHLVAEATEQCLADLRRHFVHQHNPLPLRRCIPQAGDKSREFKGVIEDRFGAHPGDCLLPSGGLQKRRTQPEPVPNQVEEGLGIFGKSALDEAWGRLVGMSLSKLIGNLPE